MKKIYYTLLTCCCLTSLSIVANAQQGPCQATFAPLPYYQDFESWVNQCDTLDAPDLHWINSSATGEDSWRRDDQGGTAGWVDTFYAPGILVGFLQYLPVAALGNHSARYHATLADTTGSLDLHLNCSGVGNGPNSLTFYYINETGNYLNVYLSTDNGTTFTSLVNLGINQYPYPGVWQKVSLPFTSSSAQTIIRFTGAPGGASSGGYADVGIDDIQVLPACQGMPDAGSIVVDRNCPGTGTTLALEGTTVAVELAYTWQQSLDSIGWSTIAGATLPYVTVDPSAPTWYRAIVTCTNSGLSDTAKDIHIAPYLQPFATVPYTQDFESWMNACDSMDAPDSNWTNTPATGDDSWRRNDQAATAAWQWLTYPFLDSPEQVYGPASGNHWALFNNIDAQASSTGTLDLHVNCSSVTGNKQLSFYYIDEDDFGSSMDVYISRNNGATFSLMASYIQVIKWTQFTLPFVSDSPKTIIRFVATAAPGNFNTGLDLVQIIVPCAGGPAAGNITVSKNCPGVGFDLSLAGSTNALGLSYAWQQSANGINWNTIVGDTLISTAVNPATLTYYRAIVTCNVSGLSDTTASVHLLTAIQAYAAIPYVQGFESWINHCDSMDAPDSNWTNTPATGDDSWRREDQGTTAGWVYASWGLPWFYWPIPGDTAVSGHFALFHATGAAGTSGTLDLHVNCSTIPGTKLLRFYYENPYSAVDSMMVLLSTDSGTTFTQLAAYGAAGGEVANWPQFTLPIATNSPKAIIRFEAKMDNDISGVSNEMGLDSVRIIAPCQGMPDAGDLVFLNNICADNDQSYGAVNEYDSIVFGAYATLALINTTFAGGIAYSWQQSADTITWSTIAGDTAASIQVLPTTPTYYRAIVTCTGSGLSDTTAASELVTPFLIYASLPYIQHFDSWITRCAQPSLGDSLDIPDLSWVNTPFTGPSSWRREDQGYTAEMGPGTANYAPYMGALNTPHSALFNTGTFANGYLSLYIDCSTDTNAKQLSFYVINQDTMQDQGVWVSVSTDGGNTFAVLGEFGVYDSLWTHYTMPIVSNSPKTVIKFTATTGQDGPDIGLDEVGVFVQCTQTPAAGSIVTSGNCPANGASLALAGATEAGTPGIQYTWQQFVNTAWVTIPADTLPTANVTPAAPTYYRAIVTCSSSGLSDTTAATLVNPAIFGYQYAAIPYTQNFESWTSQCSNLDVPDTGRVWGNNPATGNRSWRREDQGSSAYWTEPPTVNYVAPAGEHYACFSFPYANYGITATADTSSSFDLHVNCSTVTGTKLLQFYCISPEGTITTLNSNEKRLDVYLSVDGGATFTHLGTYGAIPYWTQYSCPIVSDAPKTVIRFVGTYPIGSSDVTSIGLDYVQVKLPCQGQPVAGNIASVGCPTGGDIVNLSLAGDTSDVGGLQYAWQQSANGSTGWSSIIGDTIPAIVVTPPSLIYYRCIVTCSASGLSDTTDVLQVHPPVYSYAAIPYIQDFESWVNECDTLDAPDENWTNTPPTGDDSWRREDEGPSAHWDDFGIIGDDTVITGNHYATFHTWSGGNTNIIGANALDLHVNCSTDTGTKQLSFYCINGNYSLYYGIDYDSLGVYLSVDAGNTFTKIADCPAIVTQLQVNSRPYWVRYFLPIASQSAQTVIRFVAEGYGAEYAIGLDDVHVCAAADDTASHLTVIDSICPGSFYTLPDSTIVDTLGTYQTTLNEPLSCGSLIVTTHLVSIVDTTVTQSGDSLIANNNNGNVTYQWFDLYNGYVPGATDQVFVPSSHDTTGYYVAITKNGCTVPSMIYYDANSEGIKIVGPGNTVQLYPNPVNNTLYISLNNAYAPLATVVITNIVGEKVIERAFSGSSTTIDMAGLADGTYVVKIINGDDHFIAKIVKE